MRWVPGLRSVPSLAREDRGSERPTFAQGRANRDHAGLAKKRFPAAMERLGWDNEEDEQADS